ncbi:acyl-CoA N-acyltransferase [Gloeopeniophorella convolvens]|nr:acyl-CoA N-acyltransferase [Gloeopeniophorella convolvens]
MAYINSYKSPEDPQLPSEYLGPDPYDINFSLPIDERYLETERVKLTPFIPAIHAKEYWDQLQQTPELHRFISFNFTSFDQLVRWFELGVRRDPGWVLFAVIDKASGGKMAGIIGLIKTEPANLSTEIGYVVMFKAYHRTYVTSNAVGILLRYSLELPTAPHPGLGLRRVQWVTHSYNAASFNTATRMGFKPEGTLRWHWILPEGKEGNGSQPREGDPTGRPARDNKYLSFCADDWEKGGREHVDKVIDRQT